MKGLVTKVRSGINALLWILILKMFIGGRPPNFLKSLFFFLPPRNLTAALRLCLKCKVIPLWAILGTLFNAYSSAGKIIFERI